MQQAQCRGLSSSFKGLCKSRSRVLGFRDLRIKLGIWEGGILQCKYRKQPSAFFNLGLSLLGPGAPWALDLDAFRSPGGPRNPKPKPLKPFYIGCWSSGS